MRHIVARETSRLRSHPTIAGDQRGIGYVEMLILVVALSLAAIAAVRALSSGMGGKMECTGDAIISLVPGASRCAAASNGNGNVLPGDLPTGGANDSAGAPAGGDNIETVAEPGQPGGQQGQPGQPGQGQPGGQQGQPGQGQPGQPGGQQGQPGQPGGQQGQQGQPGQPGGQQGQQGQPGGQQGQPGQAAPGEEGGEEEGGAEFKGGGEGGGNFTNNRRETSVDRNFGGAPAPAAEDPNNPQNTGVKPEGNAEIGVEKKFFEEEGALGQTKFAGGSETLSGGFASASGSGFANASLKDGVAAGGKLEGKASAVNLKGEHELPGGIKESHEVDVLSVNGSVEAKAGISKDVVGASVSADVGANIVEAKVEGKKEFKIPFTNIGIEVGGSASGTVGANAGAEATAGFFKGEDGKSRIGLSAGAKAALGLGLGGKLSLNIVF